MLQLRGRREIDEGPAYLIIRGLSKSTENEVDAIFSMQLKAVAELEGI